MKKTSQQGSASAILTIILVVGLVFALGWIFWQNFIFKGDDTDTLAVEQPKSAPATSMKTGSIDEGFNTSLKFKYPETWKLSSSVDGPLPIGTDSGTTQKITINSPSGAYQVAYTVSNGGLGGACDPATSAHIASVSTEELPAYPGVSYVTYTVEGDDANTLPMTSGFAGLHATDAAKKYADGDSVCDAYLKGVLSLDRETGVSLIDAVIIKGAVDDTNKEYQQAKQILLSTTH